MPLPIFYYFELVKVNRYRWARQCPSPSLSELPKSYLLINFWELILKKWPIPLPIFYYFELIREALANTL